MSCFVLTRFWFLFDVPMFALFLVLLVVGVLFVCVALLCVLLVVVVSVCVLTSAHHFLYAVRKWWADALHFECVLYRYY